MRHRAISLGNRRCTWCAAAIALAAMAPCATSQALIHQWTGTTQPLWDHFGWALCGIGDIDGDRVPDIAIGAGAMDLGPATSAGRLYVFSGRTGNTIFTVDGAPPYESLATGLSPTGDVDHDGVPDLLASSSLLPPWGGFHLISGRTGTIVASYADYVSAAGVGDVDGDGWGDMLFGRYQLLVPPWGPPPLQGPGLAFVISGRTGAAIHSFSGTYFQQQFGRLVASAGDTDGDGVQDLLIGASGSPPWTTPDGIWVYSGATGALLLRVPITWASDTFPVCLAGVGDVDGDGFDEVAAGDFGFQSLLNNPAVLVFGIQSPTPQFTLVAPAGDLTGSHVSGPGDVDGDGFDDVFTQETFFVSTLIQRRLVLHSGRTQARLLSMDGAYTSAPLGDVNGDDFPDLLTTHHDAIPTLVRVYSGAPTGVTAFGQGCEGANGIVPRIGCTYVPTRGQPFEIHVSRARTGAPALCVLGTSATQWLGVPLPVHLAPLGMEGCWLRVAAEATEITTTTGPANKGRATRTLQIPNSPQLAGATFHAQWFVFESPGSPRLACSTRALAMTIQ